MCDRQIKIDTPNLISKHRSNNFVYIDECILPEIQYIWSLGIITTGCCCGHGLESPIVFVDYEYIQKMKDLGYVNCTDKECESRQDIFVLKGRLT